MYSSFYNFTTLTVMPLSEQDIEQAIELYRSGAKIPEIALIFGVTKQAISQRFKKHGIERPLPAPSLALAETMEEFERQFALSTAAERKRRLARVAVQAAIKKGQITRQPCEECGEKKTEAHHDDYDKPLDVRWVCFVCHRKWHKERWHKDRDKEPKQKATA